MKRLALAVVLGASLLACSGPANSPSPSATSRLNAEGVRRLERGDEPGAEAMFRDALKEAELVDDLVGQAESWNNLGALAMAHGHADEAWACHASALRLHQQRGVRDGGEVRARANLGSALLSAGKLDAARGQFDEAIALATSIGQPQAAVLAKAGLAAVVLRQGDAKRAASLADDAASAAAGAGDEGAQASALAVSGAALESQGRLADARGRLEQALDLDRKRGAARGVADDLRALARVAERAGKAAEASSLLSRASRAARRLGDLDGAAKDLAHAIELARSSAPEGAAALEAELQALQGARKTGSRSGD